MKLSDDDVLAIRRRYSAGEYEDALAGEFDIDRSYVCRIVRGQRRGTLEAVDGPRHARRVDSWAKAERERRGHRNEARRAGPAEQS
jgi:hypothetical protein